MVGRRALFRLRQPLPNIGARRAALLAGHAGIRAGIPDQPEYRPSLTFQRAVLYGIFPVLDQHAIR